MHRTGELYGQFKTLDQQKDTATLGMWIFLVTEIMFFGGILLAYTLNRHAYFTAFSVGSNTLDLSLGGFNTVLLLASSFTMAMAVWSAQTGKKQWITIFLILTLVLGCGFLGIKYIEYSQKFHHHLVPGKKFDPCATLLFCVFRADRPARVAHGYRRGLADLAAATIGRRAFHPGVQQPGGNHRVVLALRGHRVDLSVSAALFE